MSAEFLAVVFGLTSAACWGAGDFSGGLATRRGTVYGVVMVSQLVGVTLLASLALLLAEQISPSRDLLWGGLAGVCGAIGLVALYRGLALGRMGLVAPVAALVSAAVPVLFGALVEGLPTTRQATGFGTALLAVWFVTRSDGAIRVHPRDLILPLVAGLGFGVFLIFVDRVSDEAILWPLVSARIVSLSMLFSLTALKGQPRLPTTGQLPVIALVGILDSGGNAFFALAAQLGRLDIAAVLSSLYPAVTVLLARFILQEEVSGRQWAGVATALAAVLLIAL